MDLDVVIAATIRAGRLEFKRRGVIVSDILSVCVQEIVDVYGNTVSRVELVPQAEIEQAACLRVNLV
jgi:hypothetical protein